MDEDEHPETQDDQEDPEVASLGNGGFVVVWESGAQGNNYSNNPQDGSYTGIFGQVFDGSGNKTGSEFQVNTTTDSFQMNPTVTSLEGGGFVVVWHSHEGDGYVGKGQRYAADVMCTTSLTHACRFNHPEDVQVVLQSVQRQLASLICLALL